MKKILNIILFLFIFLSCKSQDSEIDSTIKLLQSQVSDLYEENYSLKNETTKLLSFIDSLGLVIEGLEASQPSGSFDVIADTFNFTLFDTVGNKAMFYKYGEQMNFTLVKDTLRASIFWQGLPRFVIFMDDLETDLSVSEDSNKYSVYFVDEKITLEKTK